MPLKPRFSPENPARVARNEHSRVRNYGGVFLCLLRGASKVRFIPYFERKSGLKCSLGGELEALTPFADAQGRELGSVAVNKVSHPRRISLGILPQRPSDCLINKELSRAKVLHDDFLQQLGIGALLARTLVVNGDGADPEVRVLRPLQHQRVKLGVTQDDISDDGV